MKVPREWHKSFFVNSFYNPASQTAVARARPEAAFVLKKLKLRKGSSLLDLCCGPGRHAVEFARRGMKVTGLDFSAEYLREAETRAKDKKVALRLVRGDMRRIPFRGEFDAAVNLFTSFGYFPRFSDDIRTLKGVARALKPGGLFLLDIANGDRIRGNFQPRSWHEREDGGWLLEERRLTADGNFNEWIKVGPAGKARRRKFFVRVYDRPRVSSALRRAGMTPLKFWGGFDGSRLLPSSLRLICLARRAKPRRLPK
ncbi:MAG TPA: class I SAM-dependent methyltransferase [Elusimicrobiales bacterium]|nr:class I SAM-dependent methyltransferase [Elusimicrobiales bacterium]